MGLARVVARAASVVGGMARWAVAAGIASGARSVRLTSLCFARSQAIAPPERRLSGVPNWRPRRGQNGNGQGQRGAPALAVEGRNFPLHLCPSRVEAREPF